MSPSPPLLLVEGLAVDLSGQRIVSDIELSLAEGESFALLGPSGCGKTTILRSIAGLQAIAAGTISYDGRDLANHTTGLDLAPEVRDIGLVFQEGAVFPHLNVADNIGFGLSHLPTAERQSRVEDLLETLGLSGKGGRAPHELSGGERQRVALGRAIARSPRLVLLDEPFANLDAVLRVRLRREVFQLLRDQGIASLLVTHDQDEAADVADRMAVLDQGRLLQTGPPGELRRQPVSKEVAGFVGNGSLIPLDIENGVARLRHRTVPITNQPADGGATAVLQPEELALADASEGDLQGIVQRVDTLGGAPILVLEMRGPMGTHEVRVALGPESPPTKGTTVGLRIVVPTIYVLPTT